MFKNLFNKNKQVMNATIEAEVMPEVTTIDNFEIPNIEEFDILDVANQQEVEEPQEVEETQEIEENESFVIPDDVLKQISEETQKNEEIDVNYLIDSPEVVGWSSKQEQDILFDALLSKWESNESILDVGCARADLFGFIKEHYPDDTITYKGIDYNPNILNIAKEKYPLVNVEALDLLSLDNEAEYDWVVGSGLFNVNEQEDLSAYTSNCIDKMYEKCKVGVAFNLNIGKAEDNNEMLISWNSSEWLAYLMAKYGKIICRADYLDTDVTFFILK